MNEALYFKCWKKKFHTWRARWWRFCVSSLVLLWVVVWWACWSGSKTTNPPRHLTPVEWRPEKVPKCSNATTLRSMQRQSRSKIQLLNLKMKPELYSYKPQTSTLTLPMEPVQYRRSIGYIHRTTKIWYLLIITAAGMSSMLHQKCWRL